MFKRILKVVGIVLACVLVGLGILVGILFLHGKFKKSHVEPTRIYFDYENSELNVTYYCNGVDYKGAKQSNIYSFVLKATPEDVTELDCAMSVGVGRDLITFCDENGKVISSSNIKIGQTVYFKINDNFDNASDAKIEEYNKTKGSVNIGFKSSNGLCIADLKINIDRAINEVSLKDWNNTSNNEFTLGKFNYETQDDKTLKIKVEPNDRFLLEPIFAPAISNKPFADKDGKICKIYYEYETDGENNFYEVGVDNGHEFIQKDGDKYYFVGKQSGDYVFHVVTYPTYAIQEDFLNNYSEDRELDDLIYNNAHAVTRKVIISVSASKIEKATFEADDRYLNLKLFNKSSIAVSDDADGALGLMLRMYNNDVMDDRYLITSRYNQISFLSDNDFISGEILINGRMTDGEGNTSNASIRINASNIIFEGFNVYEEDAYDGNYSYTLTKDGTTFKLKVLDSEGKEISKLELSFEIGGDIKNGYYTVGLSTGTLNDFNLTMKNGIVLVKQEGEDNYTIGCFKTGTYLVLADTNGVSYNEYFEISTSLDGAKKQFSLIPKDNVGELKLYCLMINEDKTSAYTNNHWSVTIATDETEIPSIDEQVLKIDISNKTKGVAIDGENGIVKIAKGSYTIPLLLAKLGDTIKVKTLNQVRFIKDGNTYVLVGAYENGKFINEVIAKPGYIGTQDLYVYTPEYSYGTTSADEIVNAYLSGLENITTSDNSTLSGVLSIGASVTLGGKNATITDVEETEGTIKVTLKVANNNAGVITYDDQTIEISVGGNEKAFLDKEIKKDFKRTIKFDVEYVADISDDRINLDFGLTITDKSSGNANTAKSGDEIEIKEGTLGKTEDTSPADVLYLDISLKGQSSIIELISNDTNDENKVSYSSGLGNRFNLYLKMYGKKTKTEKLAKISFKKDESGKISYEIEEGDLTKYFEIVACVCADPAGGDKVIRLYFSTISVQDDSFEDYYFSVIFEYAGVRYESAKIIVISTAVKGYGFNGASDLENSFKDYNLECVIGADENGYTYSLTAVHKTDKTKNISMASNLTELNIFNDTYFSAYETGFPDDEYAFIATSENTDIAEIVEMGEDATKYYVLKIKSLTEGVKITLTNKTKGTVSSTFNLIIEKDDNLTFETKKSLNINDANATDINKGAGQANNLFNLEYHKSETEAVNLFNINGIVNLSVSNISKAEFGFKEETADNGTITTTIYDKTRYVDNDGKDAEYNKEEFDNGEITYKPVAKLWYDDTIYWKIQRESDYILEEFSVTLTASTVLGSKEGTVNFKSTVNIGVNYEHSLYGKKVDYYIGTNLQIASKYDADKTDLYNTLYILRSETGRSFELQVCNNDVWNKVNEGFDLTFKGDNAILTALAEGEYDARIYYNDNKYLKFTIVVHKNIIVDVKNSDNSTNSKDNPYEIKWDGNDAEIELTSQITAFNYDTGNIYYYYDTSNTARFKEIESDITYSIVSTINVNTEKSDGTEFELDSSTLKLSWYKYLVENKYEVKFTLNDASVSLFVNVNTTANIELKNNTLEAYTRKEFGYKDLTNGFVLSGLPTGIAIDSVTNITKDSSLDEIVEAGVVDYGGETIGIYVKYNAPQYKDTDGNNGKITLTITFGLDGNELVGDFEFEILPYELKLALSGPLTAGTGCTFKDMFASDGKYAADDLITPGYFKYVTKIEFVDSSDFTLSTYTMTELTKDKYDLTLTPKKKGADYKAKLVLKLTYTDESTHEQTVEIDIKNPYSAEVSYKFGDLKLGESELNNIVAIDEDGNEITNGNTILNLTNSQCYDLVLSNESINLNEIGFKVKDSAGNYKEDTKINKIRLAGLITLNNDSYKDKITINNKDASITFGDFGYCGFAIFEVWDTNYAYTYYVVRLTLKVMNLTSENYSSVLSLNRDLGKLEYTMTGDTSISDIITTSELTLRIESLSKSAIENGQLSFYERIENTIARTKITDNITTVNDVTRKTISVVIKTSRGGEVYLGDIKLILLPDVTIGAVEGSGLTVADGEYFAFNLEVKYDYDNPSNNSFSLANKLTCSVVPSSVDNGSIENVNKTTETDFSSLVTLSGAVLTLKTNISSQITFDVKLTLNTGLIVTIHVTYKPFENTNKTRDYILGTNNNKLKFGDLVTPYTGNIEYSIDEKSNTVTEAHEYSFTLTQTEQTQVLVLKLKDIDGEPSYTFNIKLEPSYKYITNTQETSIKTTRATSETDYTTSISYSYAGNEFKVDGNDLVNSTISEAIEEIKFYKLDGTEMGIIKTYDTTGQKITFKALSEDISGYLEIKFEGIDEKLKIFVTVVKTYVLTAQYRISGMSEDKAYEAVKLDTTLTLSDFLFATNLAGGADKTINKKTIYNNRLTIAKVTVEDGKEVTGAKAYITYEAFQGIVGEPNFGVYYLSDGKYIDATGTYSSYNSSDKKYTLITEGTVYFGMFNDFGLEFYYRVQVQPEDRYIENFGFNLDNKNTDYKDESGNITVSYYSVTLEELKKENGYKLLTLTYTPTDDNYFDLNWTVTNITLNGAEFSYDKSSNVIYLKLTDDEKDPLSLADGAYLDISIITNNGISRSIKLYITNLVIENGNKTSDNIVLAETIYAHSEGVALSGKNSSGKQRITLKIGTEEKVYNDDNTTRLYYVAYQGCYAGGVNYDAGDTTIVKVKNKTIDDINYMTDTFMLQGVSYDTSVTLYYFVYYKNSSEYIKIANFEYVLNVKNDITISFSGVNENETNIDIYLANYAYDSIHQITEVDLMSKQDDPTSPTLYRNYIRYYSGLDGKYLYDGTTDNYVSSLMKFEIEKVLVGGSEVAITNYATITQNGLLTIKNDTEQTVVLKVTAQYTQSYYKTFELNIVPSITAERKYGDSEVDGGVSGAGYTSNAAQNLITIDTSQKTAGIILYKQVYGSDLTLSSNTADEIEITHSYKIDQNVESKAEKFTLKKGEENKTLQIKLPIVPYSLNSSYIVSYKVEFVTRATTRTYYVNYRVINNNTLEISNTYKNNGQKITVGENALNASGNLTLYNKESVDKDIAPNSLFTSNGGGTIANGGKVVISNIKDESGTARGDKTFNISGDADNLYINLGTDTIFSNSMTFTLTIQSADGLGLVVSEGWSMEAPEGEKITFTNHKAFSDLFLRSELPEELKDKEFTAVVMSGTPSYGTYNTKNKSADPIKTITRTNGSITNVYKIYSIQVTKLGASANFYDLVSTTYYIETENTTFLQVNSYNYISKIYDDITSNISLDFKEFISTWSPSDWTTTGVIGSSMSVTITSNPFDNDKANNTGTSYSETTLTLTIDKSKLRTGEIYTFEIEFVYSGIVRSLRVDIIIDANAKTSTEPAGS